MIYIMYTKHQYHFSTKLLWLNEAHNHLFQITTGVTCSISTSVTIMMWIVVDCIDIIGLTFIFKTISVRRIEYIYCSFFISIDVYTHKNQQVISHRTILTQQLFADSRNMYRYIFSAMMTSQCLSFQLATTTLLRVSIFSTRSSALAEVYVLDP